MFELTTQGSVNVLRGPLPLTSENVPTAESLCEPCFQRGAPKLVIDMATMPLIDSRGLEWLIDTHFKSLRRGGRMTIAAPNTLCMDILRVTEVPDRCRIHADVLSAVGGYNQ